MENNYRISLILYLDPLISRKATARLATKGEPPSLKATRAPAGRGQTASSSTHCTAHTTADTSTAGALVTERRARQSSGARPRGVTRRGLRAIPHLSPCQARGSCRVSLLSPRSNWEAKGVPSSMENIHRASPTPPVGPLVRKNMSRPSRCTAHAVHDTGASWFTVPGPEI